MAIITNTIHYLDGDVLLEGFFAYDERQQGQRPTVLINHAWGGRDEFVANKARQLAELGYFAFALDMYGKGVLGKNAEENSQLMQPFMQNRAMLQQRVLTALTTVKLLPWCDEHKIAAIGFCFGGLCVLDLARTGADIKGVVSFHGLFTPPNTFPQPPITAKVLLLHGYDDPMVPPDAVINLAQELSAKGADWQLHAYGNTVHAFTNPKANDPDFGTIYNAKADKRSWQAMENFLSEIFG